MFDQLHRVHKLAMGLFYQPPSTACCAELPQLRGTYIPSSFFNQSISGRRCKVAW
jgi:hypothetical protein